MTAASMMVSPVAKNTPGTPVIMPAEVMNKIAPKAKRRAEKIFT